LSKPRAVPVNPPDLWIHGNAADVADKMSDDDRDSSLHPSLPTTRPSARTGLSASVVKVPLHNQCVFH